MAITPIATPMNPNPAAAPGTAAAVYGATPNASLTTPSPYTSGAFNPTSNMLGAGNNAWQMLAGGPAQSRTSSTSTTTRSPYAPLIGPINSYIQGTEALYGGGAPQISPAEQAGYTALTNAGTGPSQNYLNTAAGSGANISSGALMNINSNPYLQSIVGETGSQALQDVNKTFGGAERGGGLNQYFGAEGAAQAVGNLLNSDYATNVGATTAANAAAPSNVAASLAFPEAQISAGTDQTLRPYELNQNLGGIWAQLAGLGGSSTTNAQSASTSMAQSGGIMGQILNNLFSPTGAATKLLGSV